VPATTVVSGEPEIKGAAAAGAVGAVGAVSLCVGGMEVVEDPSAPQAEIRTAASAHKK